MCTLQCGETSPTPQLPIALGGSALGIAHRHIECRESEMGPAAARSPNLAYRPARIAFDAPWRKRSEPTAAVLVSGHDVDETHPTLNRLTNRIVARGRSAEGQAMVSAELVRHALGANRLAWSSPWFCSAVRGASDPA